MGGDLARAGFRFQDLYLLLRLLREAAQTIEQNTANIAVPRPINVRFGIEARIEFDEVAGAGQPKWDVIVTTPSHIEAIEVKSGEIDRKDRITFWRRLRRELSASPLEVQIQPILVVDPDRIANVSYWEKTASRSRKFFWIWSSVRPVACTRPQ